MQDTIFWSEDEKYQKLWENKEWFPLLEKDMKKYSEELKKYGIKKVIAFDQIGEKWEDWACEEQLTLSILPISNIVNQNGNTTKQLLKDLGYQVKEKYMPIDIETNEEYQYHSFIYYFPTRNLLISLVNPFHNQKLYNEVYGDIAKVNPKFMSQEEIWNYKLEAQWRTNFEERERRAQSKINEFERAAETYRDSYFMQVREGMLAHRELEKLKEVKKDISKHIQQELEDIKKLPMIKELKIRDKIYVSFGTIHITGGVRIGTVKKDGIDVPNIVPKKVEIGNLTFIIGSGDVIVKNDKPVGTYMHPHADAEKICFGEADIEARNLLANLEIAKLIKLLYSWAFSYNEEDAYCQLREFYEARKDADDNQEG